MRFSAQLLTLSKNKEQEATITFACALADLQKVEKLVDEVRVAFWLEGAEKEKIVGEVSGTQTSASATDKFKFKIKTPSSENIRTSQLSTLCGKELDFNIDIDPDV